MRPSWVEAERAISLEPTAFQSGFADWLRTNRDLGEEFLRRTKLAASWDNQDGYSALAILHIIGFDTDLTVNIHYTGDLGRLAIRLYPEVEESLWRGEHSLVSLDGMPEEYVAYTDPDDYDLAYRVFNTAESFSDGRFIAH